MRLLVCGSRTFTDSGLVIARLTEFLDNEVALGHQLTIVEGCARGADALAHAFQAPGVVHRHFPADWDRYGKTAGVVRNQRMLVEGKPDYVLAFVDKDLAESRGTNHMVKIARAAGVHGTVIRKLTKEVAA